MKTGRLGDKHPGGGYSASVRTPRLPLARALLLGIALSLSAGCVTHSHTVGIGATGAESVTARQYYWLFGLIEVNEVDAQRMSGDLTSYEIETGFGAVDFLLAPLLLPILTTSRTVVVKT